MHGDLAAGSKENSDDYLKKEEKAIQELCLEMHWELCFFLPGNLLP